jgi:hypothetical protein
MKGLITPPAERDSNLIPHEECDNPPPLSFTQNIVPSFVEFGSLLLCSGDLENDLEHLVGFDGGVECDVGSHRVGRMGEVSKWIHSNSFDHSTDP